MEQARAAEAERDELRDAVGVFVEKVETSGDWRVLHPAAMRLAEPADDSGLLDRMPGGADVDEAAVAYVPPLLASLSAQLEAERRRRTDSEQQVALLAAQVARREAELEARLDPALDEAREKERITREHALDVLERTLARNRALEADVRVLDAKVKAARVYHHAEHDDPPPRSSSLAGSPRRPDRVRSAPPISPARSMRDVVVTPRPKFGARQTRLQQRSPSPVPRSSPSSRAPSPIPPPRTPSPTPAQTPPPPPRAQTAPPAPPPAIRSLDAHLTVLEDALAAQHRERDRLAVSAPPPPFDRDQFTRTGLLEAECVRLMRRVRELELQLAGNEDPDTTVRPQPGPSAQPPPLAPAPVSGHSPPAQATLLPAIELDPHPQPMVDQQRDLLPPVQPAIDWPPFDAAGHGEHDTRLPGAYDAHPPTIHDARARSPDGQRAHPPDAHDPRQHAEHPHDARVDGSAEQRMATLAAELARAQDAVAARERDMEALREEIARLRGVQVG